jgi:hypothetical protein
MSFKQGPAEAGTETGMTAIAPIAKVSLLMGFGSVLLPTAILSFLCRLGERGS